MIILHIPSWYSSPQSPLAGVFIKEQIEAYATYYPENRNFILDLYGRRVEVMISKPMDAANRMVHYFQQPKQKINNLLPNLVELQPKFMTGNEKIFGALIDNIFNVADKQMSYLMSIGSKPRIIHAHVVYPGGVVAQWLSARYNIPYIVSEQSGVELLQSAFREYGLQNVIMDSFKNAAAVSALSKFHSRELAKLGVAETTIIPNLVDESVFIIPERESKEHVFTFFSLANLKESKGIKDLLFSIQKLLAEDDKVRFRIGGGGSKAMAFKNMASELKIDKHIAWLGEIDRETAAKEFQNCDCFVLPSKSESFGVVYIEALACGKPVVATLCGGPSDSVNTGNGLLVEVGNINQIADAMLYMMNNAKGYDAQNIRLDVLKKFSREVVTRKIEELYQKVLSN